MRILIITNLYPNILEPTRATFNRSHFRELAKHCELRIIAPVAWTDRLLHRIKGRRKLPYHETIDSIEVFHPTYFFTPKVFRSLYGFFYFLSILPSFRTINKEFNADALYATWAFPDAFAAGIISKVAKLPLVTKIHGSDIHSIDDGVRRKFTAWALRTSRKVVSVSNDLTELAHSMGVPMDNIVTLYNGVDGNTFAPIRRKNARLKLNIHSTAPTLLYVGNLKTVKGADLLVDSFAIIRKTHPSIHLYIVGHGKLKPLIEEQIDGLDLRESATLLGVQPHDKIALWMNAADLLIVPSRNEGVPNVILEAMSCGLPVVAAKVGGIPEIIEEGITGTLFETSQPLQLDKAIEASLNKKWDHRVIAQIAKNYTWTNNVKELLDILTTVTS